MNGIRLWNAVTEEEAAEINEFLATVFKGDEILTAARIREQAVRLGISLPVTLSDDDGNAATGTMVYGSDMLAVARAFRG